METEESPEPVTFKMRRTRYEPGPGLLPVPALLRSSGMLGADAVPAVSERN